MGKKRLAECRHRAGYVFCFSKLGAGIPYKSANNKIGGRHRCAGESGTFTWVKKASRTIATTMAMAPVSHGVGMEGQNATRFRSLLLLPFASSNFLCQRVASLFLFSGCHCVCFCSHSSCNRIREVCVDWIETLKNNAIYCEIDFGLFKSTQPHHTIEARTHITPRLKIVYKQIQNGKKIK